MYGVQMEREAESIDPSLLERYVMSIDGLWCPHSCHLHLARDLYRVARHLLVAEARVLPPLLAGGAGVHARVELRLVDGAAGASAESPAAQTLFLAVCLGVPGGNPIYLMMRKVVVIRESRRSR